MLIQLRGREKELYREYLARVEGKGCAITAAERTEAFLYARQKAKEESKQKG